MVEVGRLYEYSSSLIVVWVLNRGVRQGWYICQPVLHLIVNVSVNADEWGRVELYKIIKTTRLTRMTG